MLLVIAAVIVVAAIRLALAGPGGGALTTPGSAGAASAQPAAARFYVVQPGDSLWSIVRANGYRGDPRPVVDRLASTLGHHPLQPGQRIVLP